MQRKAFVLLSGGLDSTTCLYKAVVDFGPQHTFDDLHGLTETETPFVEGVSIQYGQRHQKELEYARRTCDSLGIKHTILDVGNLLSGATVMLSRDSIGTVTVPDIAYSEIKGVSPTYVPFRNGLMLSAITAHAQKYVNAQIEQETEEQRELARQMDGDVVDLRAYKETATSNAKDLCGVYFGAHAEDAHAWAYPDCSPEFIGAQANAIYIGTYMCVRLHTPLEWLTKSGVVELGTKLGVPFENTWSCYKGEDKHCGVCPTCRSRKEAFREAGIPDPTEYAA